MLGGGWSGEVELLKKNGEKIPTLETATPMLDQASQLIGYVCVNTDIRDRKRAEDILVLRSQELQALSSKLVEVQEAERRHIARELHDEIGQVLTGLKLALEIVPKLPAAAAKSKMEEATYLVNDLMGRVRELSLDLRPAMLDDLGLLPALLWHFERFTALTQVKVAYEHSGLDRRFPPEVETTAYRIVQEALTNVARHAGVDGVTVRVQAGHDGLSLHVLDDGVGFDSARALANNHSNGLAGMRERAILLGGRLILDSTPGVGTHLIAELPLDGANGDGQTG